MHHWKQPEPAFIITVRSELPTLLGRCLNSVRKQYPKCTVMVIHDGSFCTKIRDTAKEFKANYVDAAHLKCVERGLLWWSRFCNFGLMTGERYVFKMDPDTLLHRRFQSYPDLDFFGTKVGPIIQGGIVGFQNT